MNDKIDLSHGWRVGALVAAVAILTFSIDAHAQDDGWQRGSGAGKQPNASTAGDFAVVQLATTEPDKLMADWNKPTPGVSMVTNTRATRNQPIVTFIIFKGCRADAAGNCNVTVDYDTLGPDGKPTTRQRRPRSWSVTHQRPASTYSSLHQGTAYVSKTKTHWAPIRSARRSQIT